MSIESSLEARQIHDQISVCENGEPFTKVTGLCVGMCGGGLCVWEDTTRGSQNGQCYDGSRSQL